MDKILILGVTAGGKARLAFELGQKLDTEIISIDSMKVYRRMNIGTAKPPKEAQQKVKYHLIDVVEPSESFSVDKFLELTNTAIKQISAKEKPVIASGGSAMYIKALLYGIFDGPGSDESIRAGLAVRIASGGLAGLYKELSEVDSAAAERIHPNDRKRIIRAMEVFELTGRPISSFQRQFGAVNPPGDWKIIGLRREKQLESGRINARVKRLMAAGFVDEVKSLLAEKKPLSKQAACAIGYAEIISCLKGDCDLDTAVEQIKINTRRMAKSQRTWFKTFRNVNWIDASEDDTTHSLLKKTLSVLNC